MADYSDERARISIEIGESGAFETGLTPKLALPLFSVLIVYQTREAFFTFMCTHPKSRNVDRLLFTAFWFCGMHDPSRRLTTYESFHGNPSTNISWASQQGDFSVALSCATQNLELCHAISI